MGIYDLPKEIKENDFKNRIENDFKEKVKVLYDYNSKSKKYILKKDPSLNNEIKEYLKSKGFIYGGIEEITTKNWIKESPNNEKISLAMKTGAFIEFNGLTTSQIRNIFGTIKQIESLGFENKQADFIMLKPLTAYAYSRNKNDGFKVLKEKIIDPGIDEVLKDDGDKNSKFKNFVKLFEAVLSYHKYYGGK